MNRYRFIQGLKSNEELSEKERRRILRRRVAKDPWKLKCTIVMEEMADAYICLNFLESIFDIKPEELQKAIDVKLRRERRRMK